MAPRDDYDALGQRWSKAAARIVYDALPSAPWAGVFWTAAAAALGRTHDATYKQLCVRWGWVAKVDAAKRDPPEQWQERCRDCKVAIDERSTRCVRCAGKRLRRVDSVRARRQSAGSATQLARGSQ